MNIRPLTINDVVITIEAIDEDSSIEDDLRDCGEELISDLRRRLDDGDIWAWCVVKLTVSWNGWEGVDYLGGCSYDNEQDFVKDSDYYDNMVQNALNNLNKTLIENVVQLSKLAI